MELKGQRGHYSGSTINTFAHRLLITISIVREDTAGITIHSIVIHTFKLSIRNQSTIEDEVHYKIIRKHRNRDTFQGPPGQISWRFPKKLLKIRPQTRIFAF